MRVFVLILLGLSAFAIEEPEPISAAERIDEAAHSNQRTIWIACLSLARTQVIEHELDLNPVLSRSLHGKEDTRKKIIADIVYKCASSVSLELAEKIITVDSILDLDSPKIDDFLRIDESQFLDKEKDISLTPEQEELYANIRHEINRTDSGFDKDTPIVEEFVWKKEEEKGRAEVEQVDSLMVVSLVAIGVVLSSLSVMCEW